jgi:inosine-uridine nucleoside N-ribohydrolase
MNWNVQFDPRSAQYVFRHSDPTLVPMAITVQTSLRRAYLETLERSGPLARGCRTTPSISSTTR